MGSKTPRTTGCVAAAGAAPRGKRFAPIAARGARGAWGSAPATRPRKPGRQTSRAGATSQRTRPRSADVDDLGSRPRDLAKSQIVRGATAPKRTSATAALAPDEVLSPHMREVRPAWARNMALSGVHLG